MNPLRAVAAILAATVGAIAGQASGTISPSRMRTVPLKPNEGAIGLPRDTRLKALLSTRSGPPLPPGRARVVPKP